MHLCPNQLFIKSLNLCIVLAVLISSNNKFHTLAPSTLRFLSPYFAEFRVGTWRLCFLWEAFLERWKISFINTGFISFKVLKISVVKTWRRFYLHSCVSRSYVILNNHFRSHLKVALNIFLVLSQFYSSSFY